MRRTQGFLAVHMTCNPVIKINKRGTRAKGLWHSHGVCSFATNAGVFKQFLCLGKYDIEYVKETGQWKFWKFAYRLTYMCPYEKGWAEEPVAASIAGNPLNKPDKRVTYHMPYSRYRITVFRPSLPEPYGDYKIRTGIAVIQIHYVLPGPSDVHVVVDGSCSIANWNKCVLKRELCRTCIIVLLRWMTGTLDIFRVVIPLTEPVPPRAYRG
jgi:hypothetical protein